MNPDLKDIPDRILNLAIGALSQANTHAVYSDPGREYWDHMCILNAAHAGELFLKAIIAREHPLLIFKDLFSLDDNKGKLLDIETLIRRGRTHDFERLPPVLWATTGRQIPNRECYERVRLARNSIQHFCAPEKEDLRVLSLEFIYTIIDPLIMEVFGLFAIEYHEDPSVGYDYVVSSLLGRELKFSIPDDFTIAEISMTEILGGTSAKYKNWIKKQVTKIGRLDLLS